MSLKQWADNGWLRNHQTTRQEIENLLGIVERDLHDANTQGTISDDWKFGIAYNAALKLCSILLYASGYKPEKNLAHYRTLQSLPLIIGTGRAGDAEYLENCRMKRNVVEYDYVGGVSESDAEELIQFVIELKIEVIQWLTKNHSELIKRQ